VLSFVEVDMAYLQVGTKNMPQRHSMPHRVLRNKEKTGAEFRGKIEKNTGDT